MDNIEWDKFTVIKNEDIQKYFSEREKLILEAVLYSLAKRREADGKKTDNKYLVVNVDEPYAEEVAAIIMKHEHPETGDDQEFLMNEDCVQIEFKGVWYEFTKLQDKDVSKEFNKPEGTVVLTHRIDGFETPLYLLIDNENSEFTFALKAGDGSFVILKDKELHDLAVELVVYANENRLSEPKPAEEVEPENKPAEQPEEEPVNPMKAYGPVTLADLQEKPQLLDLKNGQYLLHKKGKLYKVKDVDVYHSETVDKHILYKALYKADRKKWVRPAEMFTTDRFVPLTLWEYLRYKLRWETMGNLLKTKFNKIGE